MYTKLTLRHGAIIALISTWVMLPVQAQKHSFTFVEQLVIGNDEEASAEYLFSHPRLIRTDSKGNIYINDQNRADVRVFDAGGQFVKTIGRRGQGPGEMQEIIGIHVDEQDRLIVADRMNARFTIFSNMGETFETHAFSEKYMISPQVILSLEDTYLLVYKRIVDVVKNERGFNVEEVYQNTVMHRYTRRFEPLTSFARLDLIFDFDRPFLKAVARSAKGLSVATDGHERVVVAPLVYEGFLYQYTPSGTSWVMQKLEGGPPPKRSYVLFEVDEFLADPEKRKHAILISNREGSFPARILSLNRGVFILRNGDIINFILKSPVKPSKPSELTAELFGQDGRLLGYGPVTFDDARLNQPEIGSSTMIMWKDENDRFYLVRVNEQGFYVVSVMKLEMSF